jgi:hypothetical protein
VGTGVLAGGLVGVAAGTDVSVGTLAGPAAGCSTGVHPANKPVAAANLMKCRRENLPEFGFELFCFIFPPHQYENFRFSSLNFLPRTYTQFPPFLITNFM